MDKKKSVGGVSGKILGMLEDLLHKIRKGVISMEQLEFFLNKKNPFPASKTILVQQDKGRVFDRFELIAEWQRFYLEFLGLEVDFSNLVLPNKQDGFNWLIVVPQGMTINRAIQACRKHFTVRTRTDDMDKAVSQNDRSPEDGYAIWVRDCVEADEENKNLSADDIKDKEIAGITLLERILLEAWHFWKFKKHLDIKNITLCSGSRDSGGGVPGVGWIDDELGVSWCLPGYRDSRLRARSVISS